MRQAADTEELAMPRWLDAAARVRRAARLFSDRRRHGARASVSAGVSEEAAQRRFRSLRIPLASAAALAGAVETRDPVIAAANSEPRFRRRW